MMSPEMEEKLSRTCRLCISQGQSIVMYPSFGTINEVSIADAIKFFFGIDVSEDQCTNICECCLAKIDLMFGFHDEVTKKNVEFNEMLTALQLASHVKEEKIELNSLEQQPPFSMLVVNDPQMIKIENAESSGDYITSVAEMTNLYPCDVCGEEFENSSDIPRHMQDFHQQPTVRLKAPLEEKQYGCDYCEKSFKHAVNLKAHMRSHTSTRLFECGVCNRKFKRRMHLSKHKLMHAKQKLHTCDFCQQSFILPETLIRHRKTHTKPLEIMYTCAVCNAQCCGKEEYKNHKKTHNENHSIACEICGKISSSQLHLNIHLRTHTKEKPFKCLHCGKLFTQSGSLKRHIRFHTGEKPYKCDECDKSFFRASHLSRHKSMHAGINFDCEACGKIFKSIEGWNYHKKNIHVPVGRT